MHPWRSKGSNKSSHTSHHSYCIVNFLGHPVQCSWITVTMSCPVCHKTVSIQYIKSQRKTLLTPCLLFTYNVLGCSLMQCAPETDIQQWRQVCFVKESSEDAVLRPSTQKGNANIVKYQLDREKVDLSCISTSPILISSTFGGLLTTQVCW